MWISGDLRDCSHGKEKYGVVDILKNLRGGSQFDPGYDLASFVEGSKVNVQRKLAVARVVL